MGKFDIKIPILNHFCNFPYEPLYANKVPNCNLAPEDPHAPMQQCSLKRPLIKDALRCTPVVKMQSSFSSGCT